MSLLKPPICVGRPSAGVLDVFIHPLASSLHPLYRRGGVTRPKLFIQKVLVHNLVLAVQRGLEEQDYAMLWLFAYAYLLRLPSQVWRL